MTLINSDKIRSLRRAEKLSQKELSVKSGVTRDVICKIENGQRNPGIISVARIAKGLNITVDELLTHKEKL